MADPAHVATDEMIAEIEKKLKKQYSKAAREIQEKLEDHLEAFRKKVEGRLEALHNGEITKQEYENWFRGQVATGQRWKDLQGQIADDLLNVNAIARSTAEGYKPDVYALNINYATYDVEHAGLLDTSFTLYDHQTVERIMREEPALLPPPGKLVAQEIAEGKAKRWNLQIFNSVMTQGIIQGESIDKIARRISSELSTRNYAASVRYARTAMTSAQNAGRYDGYRRARDMGVNLKIEWSATLDQRTRHDHRMLHGQRKEIDEPFEVSEYKILYPAQAGAGTSDIPQETIWNCRCTLIAWVKGFEGETVKSSPKMGDLTFEEWQQATPMTKEEQDEWIRAGKPSLKEQQKSTQEKISDDAIKRNDDAIKSIYEDHRKINGLTSASASELDMLVKWTDYGKITDEMQDAFNSTFSRLGKKYDSALYQVRTMTKNELLAKSDTFAFVVHNYETDTAELIINPIKCKDKNNLVDRLVALKKHGYFTDVPENQLINYIATHEYAHTIFDTGSKLNDKRNWVGADYKKIRAARKEMESVYSSYLSEVRDLTNKKNDFEFRYIMGDQSAQTMAKSAIEELKSVQISKYSLENADEFMAESFALEELGGNGNKYTKKAMAIIKKHFGK